MQINQSVYGAAEDWQPVYNYAAATPRDQRLLAACFDAEAANPAMIGTAITAGKLQINEVWDSSLSYCGLGPEHPLNNLLWYGHIQDSPGGQQFNKIQLIKEERHDIINFALGQALNAINGHGQDYVDGYAVLGDYASNLKFKNIRWTDGAVYNADYSNYDTFKPFTQIPLHRVVLVPYITCCSAGDPTLRDYTLLEYAAQKTSYPRIRQISIAIYTDIDSTKYENIDIDPAEGFTRGDIQNLKVLAVLNQLNGFSGMESDYYGPLNTTEILGNIFLPIISGSHAALIPIAGDLFGAVGYGTNRGSMTIMRPYASGFGINFDKWSGTDWELTADTQYIYCDASNIEYDDLKESVRHMVACFGLFFTDDSSSSYINAPLFAETMHLGTLVDGIGYGAYTSGDKNKEQDQWLMEDAHDIDYDPLEPPEIDPNTYNDGFVFPDAFSLGISGINNRYLLSTTNILTLSNALWDFAKNMQPEDVYGNLNKTFLTNNPIDLIISLQYLPVKDISFGSSSAVKLGRLALGVNATSVKSANSYDCGYIKVFPTFGDNWISKNIRIFAYLPFCGTVEIDNESVMGHNLYLRYLVDTYTGSCTAVLYIINSKNQDIIVNTADGNCITDIPVTGIQWETLNANLYNAYQTNKQLKLTNNLSIAKALTGFGSVLGSGDLAGAAAAGLDFASAATSGFTAERISDYNLSHTQIPMRAIGGSSGITSNLLDTIPKLIFYRPIDRGSNEFISSEGVSCIKNGTLTSLQLSGYTEISKIDLNGLAATAAEKEMIRSLCSSGIYV